MTVFGLDCTPGVYSTASRPSKYVHSIWGFCENVETDPVVPGWGLRCCTSDKLPEDADATGPGPSL